MPPKRKTIRAPARDCPTCGAKARKPCSTASDQPKPVPHAARSATPATAAREPDPARAPRFARWATHQPGPQATFDAEKRARLVEAVAVLGRMREASDLVGVHYQTVAAWRRKGLAQLAAAEKHEAAQDRLVAADPGHQRLPYQGSMEAARFALELARAAAWWEANHQSRLQQAAERETDESGYSITLALLARHDRLTGRVKGEVHEHHHHAAPSAIDKLGEIVARRRALRGEQ